MTNGSEHAELRTGAIPATRCRIVRPDRRRDRFMEHKIRRAVQPAGPRHRMDPRSCRKRVGASDLIRSFEGKVAVLIAGYFWPGRPTHGDIAATKNFLWESKVEATQGIRAIELGMRPTRFDLATLGSKGPRSSALGADLATRCNRNETRFGQHLAGKSILRVEVRTPGAGERPRQRPDTQGAEALVAIDHAKDAPRDCENRERGSQKGDVIIETSDRSPGKSRSRR